MPIVLVDMDGVVADISPAIQAYITETFPDAQVVRPGVWEHAERYGLRTNDLQEWFYTEGTFRNLPVIEGAQEAVAKIAEHADVWFCSTPKSSAYCAAEKQDWIKEHFPKYGRKLILTKDKTLVRGNWLIDDKPHITGVMRPEWKHVWYDPRNFTWADVDEFLEHINANRTLRVTRCW